jgi:hypothetical protein
MRQSPHTTLGGEKDFPVKQNSEATNENIDWVGNKTKLSSVQCNRIQ